MSVRSARPGGTMERADLFKLSEVFVIFAAVGGFLAWEWWQTRKLVKADRLAASREVDDLAPGQDHESSQ
jgi:hypothetical protein